MYKYITILLIMCFGLTLKGQIEVDKQKHFYATAMISSSTTALSWKWLSSDPDMGILEAKIYATGIGFGTGILIGYLKEIVDKETKSHFSKEDMKYNIIGSLTGSLVMFTILIPSIPECKVPEEDIFDEFPLIEK